MTVDTVRMSVERMRCLCVDTLGEAGARGEVAEAVAEHLVDAEVIGHHTHGLLQLPSLVRDIRSGHLDPEATPAIEPDGGQLRVDARRAMAQWALPGIVDRAVEAAQGDGVCLALVRNLRSTGRLGAYVERAAKAGMAALLVTGSLGDPKDALVAAFGGRDRLLGTNPIAFAAPTSSTPLVVDLSTAATTMGEVRRSRVLGHRLSTPAVMDSSGSLTREPAAFYAGGAIAPMAGHKGYALAVMVAALGALVGGHDAEGSVSGSFLLVARPAAADYPAALGAGLDRIRRTGPNDGTGVRVPGDRHQDARHRARRAGVAVQTAVLNEISRARKGASRNE